MSARPSDLSRTPTLGDDVLADVLSLGFLRDARYRPIEARAPWGLAIAASHRATLYLIARGQARLELPEQRPLALAAGQVAFLPRGVAHVLRDAPTSKAIPTTAARVGGRGAATSIIATYFERDRTPPALLDRPADVVVLAGAENPIVTGTIASVLAELDHPGPASALLLQRLADVLVVQAMRELAKQPSCQASRRPGLIALSDPPIHEALSLMHARVEHAWSVAELASRVGLSRSGFAARFRELVGEPPLQYLARWRMTRAAELLRDTREPIATIAQRVGYDSTPSFNKAFKRWKATSPGAFRRGAA